MQTFKIISITLLLALAFSCSQATLIAMPRRHFFSVCIGETINMEVETGGSNATPLNIRWEHKNNYVDDPVHFSISKGGRVLTITDSLPPHSGEYFAHIESGNKSTQVTFLVEVIGDINYPTYFNPHFLHPDLHFRTLVKSPFKIPVGGTGILKVSNPTEGVLWWMHRGRPVQTTEKSSHFRFMDTQEATGSMLEISNAQPQHGGFFEVVLKKGKCEARNLIHVVIIQEKLVEDGEEPDTIRIAGTLMTIDYTFILLILGSLLPAILIVVGLAVVHLLNKEGEKKKKTKIDSLIDLEDGVVGGVLMEDPIYTAMYREAQIRHETKLGFEPEAYGVSEYSSDSEYNPYQDIGDMDDYQGLDPAGAPTMMDYHIFGPVTRGP